MNGRCIVEINYCLTNIITVSEQDYDIMFVSRHVSRFTDPSMPYSLVVSCFDISESMSALLLEPENKVNAFD